MKGVLKKEKIDAGTEREEWNSEDLLEDDDRSYPYVSNIAAHLAKNESKEIKHLTPELHYTLPSKHLRTSPKKQQKKEYTRRGIKPPLYILNKKVTHFPNRNIDVVKLAELKPDSEIMKRH